MITKESKQEIEVLNTVFDTCDIDFENGKYFFKELLELKNITEKGEDLLTHTLNCLKIYKENVHKHFNVKDDYGYIFNFSTMMAILLHDVGKISTMRMSAMGSPYFPQHEVESGKIVKNYIPNKFSNIFSSIDLENIYFLVRNHMNMYKFSKVDAPKREELMSHNSFPDLLMLHKCCVESKTRRGDNNWSEAKNLEEIEAAFKKRGKKKGKVTDVKTEEPSSKFDKFLCP